MNIYEKLLTVQGKLKAPKSQYNSFGKYKYRNAEDILEAVKPLCQEVKAVVILTDELKNIGDRYYVEATAKFIDTEPQGTMISFIDVKASAREEETKKGMDESQVTGASSSYARKYALNGLFAIDDTKDSDSTNNKDSDSTNNGGEPEKKADDQPEETPTLFPELPPEEPMMTLEEALEIEVKTKDGVKKLKELSDEQLELGSKGWAYKRWTDGAKLILTYRAGIKK